MNSPGLQSGQWLGPYEIVAPLGAGGMGEVYRAKDPRLEREVALKVLPSDFAENPERLERFRREARSLAAVSHPSIVTVHSVEEANGVHFLTMELVEGRTLDEVIPPPGMPLERFFAVAVPLAEAVAAAHARGVVHRDLKPGNVMVTEDGQVKVLDFGLARRLASEGEDLTALPTQSLTFEGSLLGTIPYLAPEQVKGEPADRRSDLFALGVMLYEMLTGRHPFRRASPAETLSSILRDEPSSVAEQRPDLPGHLARLVRLCLRKDPERRLQSALDARNELEELARERNEGRERRRGEPSGRATQGAPRRRRRLVGLLGVALLVTLVATAYLVWPGREGAAPPAAEPVTLAVLPFENLSPEQENEYFAEGITEEITSKLARLEGLRVSARTSAARFADQGLDVREIGGQLGVRYLLEGSVRKAGDRVRITAQLIGTETGFHLWSEEFEGDLGDVFAIQEETARQIAQALDVELSREERRELAERYTDDPEAYDAYLRGRALTDISDTPEKLTAARRHYEQALRLDPDFPPALAGLAHTLALHYRNAEADPELLEKAERLARRAVDQAPELPMARIAMGTVHANRYDYGRAATEFRRATELDPDDPLAWDLLSWTLAYQQPPDAEGAERAARRALELQSTLFGAHYHLGRALLLQGRHEEAVEAFEHARELTPTSDLGPIGQIQVHLARDEPGKALEEIRKLRYGRDTPVPQVLAARAHAALGEPEQALEELRAALAGGYRDFAHLEAAEELEDLRGDPRYRRLLARYRDGSE